MPEPSPIVLDLTGKSRDELLELKLRLDAEISSIRSQVIRARAESREGRYASPHWWSKAHQAIRIKGRQSQQIQVEMGKLRASRVKSVEAHFLDVCRERMGSDPNFKSYLETAKRRAL